MRIQSRTPQINEYKGILNVIKAHMNNNKNVLIIKDMIEF